MGVGFFNLVQYYGESLKEWGGENEINGVYINIGDIICMSDFYLKPIKTLKLLESILFLIAIIIRYI
jgi:hypothetical protein